jgi:hypothetical protein
MKKFLLAVLSLLFVYAVITPVHGADTWTLLKDSDGIKSYERSVPGTKLKEFMGVTVIDARMDAIGEALRDVPSFSKWQTDCASAEVEKKYDRNNMVIHMFLTPPVLKQRDLVLRSKTFYDWDNGKALVTFFSTDEVKVPPKDGCVRLTNMKGSYEMTYLGRQKTKFVYKLMVDPQVSFPLTIGMSYAVMKSYPYKTLGKLRILACDKKYANLTQGTEEQKGMDQRAGSEASARTIFINRLQPYVKDKGAFRAVVEGDPEIVKTLVGKGNTYECNRQCTEMAFAAYIDKTVQDKGKCQKLKNNKAFQTDLIDMVETDCGANNMTVDSLVEKYAGK